MQTARASASGMTPAAFIQRGSSVFASLSFWGPAVAIFASIAIIWFLAHQWLQRRDAQRRAERRKHAGALERERAEFFRRVASNAPVQETLRSLCDPPEHEIAG